MIAFDLFRNLLAPDERGSEENKGVGRAWDIRGVALLAVAGAVWGWERDLALWELGELGGRGGRWDGVLPDGFERGGGIRAQGRDGGHVGEEGKRHRWVRVVDEGRHSV